MNHDLTLVHPTHLEPSTLDAAMDVLRTAEARAGEARRSDSGRAYRLPFETSTPEPLETLERTLRSTLDVRGVDFAIQATDRPRPRLLVADMESTVIANEMLDELADWVGKRAEVAEITERAMNDELDFHAAIRERVALLGGLAVGVLEEAAERMTIDPGAQALVDTLGRHGVRTVLCSGGFGFFAGRVAECLGFDAWRANTFEIVDGHLTGRVVEPILDRDAKVETLRHHCAELGIEPAAATAVGDGANDLPMLHLAGLGVAFHAKPAVLEAAQSSIRHGDLSTLGYFMGFDGT